MLRGRTDRAWFGHLLRHPVRKESGVYFFNLRAHMGHPQL